jgi:succinate dehydrogenase/fumarate reductase flavoprotein subunit
MLAVARIVAQSARNRAESRGAHQREDCPQPLPQWLTHQCAVMRDGAIKISGAPAETLVS